LREWSGRARREGRPNLIYVRAAVEALPEALWGTADRLTVVLPWGSLLAAVARPVPHLLRHMRALCRPEATFVVVLGIDAVRDQAELRRLQVVPPSDGDWRAFLAGPYLDAGFRIVAARRVGKGRLDRWPSSWARRLAHGSARPFVEIEARACGPKPV
jgi:16S rRNA (adenine(1408)-N(1))-methyltransferase